MDFQDRLFDLRRQAGLSQEELANLLGVTRQAVQKWEAGTSRPDMDNLTSLAEYFKVSLDYLVTGKEASPTPAPTVVNNYNYHGFHRFEYKSKRTLFGLPLVHINVGGPGIHWARGIIAIGTVATGFVALGAIAVGLVSLGALGLGLLALGALAVGITAVGGAAIGLIALGGMAFGILTVGGISMGVYSVGGAVIASKVAIGGAACSNLLAISADAAGTQIFLIPPGGFRGDALDAVQNAIDAACEGAPGFIPWLLKLFLFAQVS